MAELASDVYRRLEAACRSPSTTTSGSDSENAALLEFQLRFLSYCVVAALRDGGSSVTLAPQTGIGAIHAFLRSNAPRLSGFTQHSEFHSVLDDVLAGLGKGVPEAPERVRTFEKLRNHLSHWGAVPGATAASP